MPKVNIISILSFNNPHAKDDFKMNILNYIFM